MAEAEPTAQELASELLRLYEEPATLALFDPDAGIANHAAAAASDVAASAPADAAANNASNAVGSVPGEVIASTRSDADTNAPAVPILDAPPPSPPAPPSPRAPPAKQPRGKRARAAPGECLAAVEGGYIVYYQSNNKFEAQCLAHAGRCTMTRQSGGPESSSSDTSANLPGRPLGLLLTWLATGALADDKDAHKDRGHVAILSGADNHDWRLRLRQEFAANPAAT